MPFSINDFQIALLGGELCLPMVGISVPVAKYK